MSDTTPLILQHFAKRSKRNIATWLSSLTTSITSIPAGAWRHAWATTAQSSTRMPDEAVESFAGVANPFSLA